MANSEPLKFRYDYQLMAEDMTLKGWTMAELSRQAGVADMSVIRFLRGEQQTAPTAKKLARALGHSLARYVIRPRTTRLPMAANA